MNQSLRELLDQLDELGGISDVPGELTRTFLSPASEEALRWVGSRMQDAGLDVEVDSVGNLVGRVPASRATRKTLILGSHLDTVRNAGRFDGALGVLLPIAAMMELGRRNIRLPFNVEIVGFSEEEGVRFNCAYIGSAGYTGQLTQAMLETCDAEGTSVQKALEGFSGARLPMPVQDRADVLGYVEVHIEQGPVLETQNLGVGVVSAIAGQKRFNVSWTGRAGHAGTTPMRLRRDALAAAAEYTLAVEKYAASRQAPFVATVGKMQVSPGAPNVIPGNVRHTLDVRDADDRRLDEAVADLVRFSKDIAARREIAISWNCTQDNVVANCSREMTAILERSVRVVQGRSISLVSGAGHDGVVVSKVAPIAMLFVRCREGLSHHPNEHASPEDVGVALDVIVDFLQKLAEETVAPPKRGRRPGSKKRSKS